MNIILWAVFGFIVGSIPFSMIFGWLIARKDVRDYGDGNPGGANALKAGGLKAGIPAISCDIFKGFLPVFLAQRNGLTGWNLLPVCLAPILGHAFSPFLKFHGGKALGATAGAWLALLGLWVFPVYATLALPFTLLQAEDAWSANAGMLALLGYAILFDGSAWLIAFAAINAALVAWTHHKDLARPMQLRTWVLHLFSGRGA